MYVDVVSVRRASHDSRASVAAMTVNTVERFSQLSGYTENWTQDFLNMKMCVEAARSPAEPPVSWLIDIPPDPGSSSRRPRPPADVHWKRE